MGTSPLQLLILEDNAFDAKSAVTVLEGADYSCSWDHVQTRQDLVTRLDRGHYDLILADYLLPDLDGLSALNLVRERGIDIPFIVCSANIGEEVLAEVFRAGATDYLLKTRLDRLPLVVARALKQRDDKRQRWRGEEALRQSERRYAAFMRNLPSVAFMKDLDGRYVYVNEAVTHLAHMMPRDWLGRTDHELWPETTARRRDESRRAVIEAGATQLSVQTVPHPDGFRHWVNVEFPIPKADGSPAMTGGVAVDLTESRRQDAERAVLLEIATTIQGMLELGEILEHVHARMLLLLPCDRVLTYRWDAAREVVQLIAADEVPEAVRPDTADAGVIAELLETWIERGRPLTESTIEGQPWVLRDWTKPFGGTAFLAAPLTVDGALTGVMVAVREKSSVKFEPRTIHLFEQIARQLARAMGAADLYSAKDEEAQLNGALAEVGYQLVSGSNSPDLLNRLCQVTTRVLNCGRSYTALWEAKEQAYVPVASHGYNAEEWDALRILKLPRTQLAEVLTRLERHEVIPVAPLEDVALAALAAVPPANTSLWMALRRGGDVHGIHIATYDNPETHLPRHYQRVGHELAQLASLAIENARLVEELRQANRVKSDFVATMSHELRTPLNSILGYTDLMLEESYGPLTAEQAQTLHKVETSGRQLLDLVNATLDVSRLDAGALPVNLMQTAVTELLAEIETDTQETRQQSSLRFVWKVPADLPPIETDRVKLKVVVMNLISNAIKFTPEGSVTVAAGTREGGVEIAITDSGIGVAPDVLSIIFEPFRQGDSSTTRRFGGVGLGLYIARRLLDLLGGTIAVESQVGSGSTFRVWVPRTIASRQGQTFNASVP